MHFLSCFPHGIQDLYEQHSTMNSQRGNCQYLTNETDSTKASGSHCGGPVGFRVSFTYHSRIHRGTAVERLRCKFFMDNPRGARELQSLRGPSMVKSSRNVFGREHSINNDRPPPKATPCDCICHSAQTITEAVCTAAISTR